MALDSSVLASIGDRGTLPAAEAPMKAMQLADLVNRQQLSKIQLQEEQEEQQTYGKLKGLIDTEKLDMSKPDDQNRLVAEASRLSPKLGMKLQREMTANQAGQAQLTQALIDLTKERMTILSDAATPFADTARKLAMGDPAHGIAPLSDQEIDAKLLPQMTQVMKKLKDVKLANGEALLSPELQQEAAQLLSGNVRKGLETFVMQHQEAMTKLDDIDKRRRMAAKEEGENRETKEIMKGGKPHQVLIEKSTGREIKDLGEAPPSAAVANQQAMSNAPVDVRQLGAWMDQNGVALAGAGRTPAQRNQRLKDIIDDPKNKGKTVEEIGKGIVTGTLGYQAEKKETQTAAAIEGRINYAVNEIQRMAPYVEELSAKVPRGSFVPWNKLSQMSEAQLSDPNLAAFKMAMTTLSNAYDVLAARGGTDMAKREENRKNFDTANSPEALKAVLGVMVQEASIAHGAAEAATHPGTTPPADTPAPPSTGESAAGGAGAITKWEMKDGKLVKVSK